MTAERAYDLKLASAILVAFLLVSIVFAFFLGKKQQEAVNKAAADKIEQQRQVERAELSENIRERDLAIAEAAEREYILEMQLKEREKEYVKIDTKYDRKADSVITLPMDAKVQFLADWLSEADSSRWRHVDSGN